ncbi:MAG: D-alanine--D-alanine ligase family protein [Patescibacteria group bacterium]
MKKKVAVFFGGKSTEHDISIVTAISSVISPLELSQEYEVVPVYISKEGSWYSDEKLKDISLYRGPELKNFLEKSKKINILFDDGLTLIKSGIRKEKIHIDIAFPAMHGTYGEDGSLMGLLRMANVPIVGCDMPASVIAMDKVLAKQAVMAKGIATPKYISFSKTDFSESTLNNIKKELSLPLFVKPSHLGSSIGISKVTKFDDLKNSIEVALHYDDKVLVEEGVEDLIEVTLPIMGNQKPVPSLLERPLVKDNDFFDFEKKYINEGGSKNGAKKGAQGYSELPAKLEKNLYDKAVDTAIKSYKAIECQGIARVDLLIDGNTKEIYFNELNPLPGDLYSHNWRANGVSKVQLVERLINYAEESFLQKNAIENTFSTNYLKQF